MLLLECSDLEGTAYIRTDNLDGEIDLKARKRASGPTESVLTEDPHEAAQYLKVFKGSTVVCERPNSKLYHFNSTMCDKSGAEPVELSLTSENLLLQSCFVRNTTWLAGTAVYTGGDTKCGINKKVPPIKIAGLDRKISRLSLGVFGMQMLITLIMSVIGNTVAADQAYDSWYLQMPNARVKRSLAIPFRFFLLTSVMIPISFKVIIDLSKYFISQAIAWDTDLYHAETDADLGGSPAKANNTAIAEDLGQIDIILTDKTGTLTENVMCFKACSVGGAQYGGGDGPFFDASASPFASEKFVSKLREGDDGIANFAKCLSLCHSVQIHQHSTAVTTPATPAPPATRFTTRTHPMYSAVSPDEEALVTAAAEMGSVLKEIRRDLMVLSVGVDDESAEEVVYELLHTFEFSSERKMMSVLVRNRSNGLIYIISKGADDRMSKRIVGGCEVADEHVANFATVGLRTLVLGMRPVSEEEYINWKIKYNNIVNTQIGADRDTSLASLYAEIETNFDLVGATGIEDKLQDDVEHTITSLREAGIAFWMLTGDKFETAQQISRSSGLWKKTEELFHLEFQSKTQVRIHIMRQIKKIQQFNEHKRLREKEKKKEHAVGVHAGKCGKQRGYGTFFKKLVHTTSDAHTDESMRTATDTSGTDPEKPVATHSNHSTHSSTSPQQLTNRSFGTIAEHVSEASYDEGEPDGHVMILEGSVVQEILDETERAKSYDTADSPFELLDRFNELCCMCTSVIFCRVTPAQKAALTRLARGKKRDSEAPSLCCFGALSSSDDRRVLSVGDGGNDVLMIQEATIGVGIVGKEGRQASRAADYSIARFRFLKKLILVHGHYSYARSSSIVLYCFYKSMLLAMVQVLFNVFTLFSGVSYWNSMMLATWNGFYTLPAPFLLVLDRVLPQESLMRTPSLYYACQREEHFSTKTFFTQLLRGAFHALVALAFTLVIFGLHHAEPGTGRTYDLQAQYTMTFTAIMFVQVWVVVLLSNTLTILNFLGIFLMPPVYFASIYAYSAMKKLSYYDTARIVFPDTSVWLMILAVNGGLFVMALFSSAAGWHLHPSKLDAAKVLSKRTALGRHGWRSVDSLPMVECEANTTSVVQAQNADVCQSDGEK